MSISVEQIFQAGLCVRLFYFQERRPANLAGKTSAAGFAEAKATLRRRRSSVSFVGAAARLLRQLTMIAAPGNTICSWFRLAYCESLRQASLVLVNA